jgi:hypothetical protein
VPNAFEGRLELIAIGMLGGLTASVFAWGMPSNVGVSGLTHELDNIAPVAVVSVLAAETDFAYPLKFIAADNSSIHEDEFPALGYVESLLGTSKNGPVIDLLSMAPDVSWVRRGLVSAISGFLPPDAQVGA